MAAQEEVDAIIESNIGVANDSVQETFRHVNEAIGIAHGAVLPGAVSDIPIPQIDVPNFINQNTDLGNDFKVALKNALGDLGPKFDAQADDFIRRWFPNFSKCLATVIDKWICDTVENGTTGIPPHVERLIWQRARDRVYTESASRSHEALTDWAGRGFALPGGVLLAQQEVITQDRTDKSYEANRDAAIKAVDVQIETIKFAVEQGVKLRLGVIAALIDFLKAWVAMNGVAVDIAKALVDAKRQLWQGLDSYYRAYIAALELTQRARMFNVEMDMKQQELDVELLTKNVARAAEVAIAAAKTLGDMAAAAMGSTNALASIDNTTIEG